MGASGWDYVTPYRGDVASSLAALHLQVFQEHYGDGGEYADLEELWNDDEFMGECGTHTVLDVFRLGSADDEPDYNTFQPLSAERLRHWFGTETPSHAEFKALWDAQQKSQAELRGDGWLNRPETLEDECTMRWSGIYVVLSTDDRPSHVAFWGYSGD